MNNFSDKYVVLVDILIFSLLGYFTHVFFSMVAELPEVTRIEFHKSRTCVMLVIAFNIIGFSVLLFNKYMYKFYPYFLNNKTRKVIYFLTDSIFLFAVIYMVFVWVRWMMHLSNPFIIEPAGLYAMLIIYIVQLIVTGQIMINYFYHNLLQTSEKAMLLEKDAFNSKYQMLQNQLNPHFLFNNLNTLISEIKYNPKDAVLFTQGMSDIYRYILKNSNQTTVSLESELEFLEPYLFLYRVRLGNCIHIQKEIDESYLDARLPPLTLQLLIENVVKHNYMSLAKPMNINISINEEEDWLIVRNMICPKQNIVSTKTGLVNLSSRYQLLCQRDIVVENNTGHFIVKVPLLSPK